MVGFVDGGSLLVRIRCAFGANLAADPATWVWTDITAYWHLPHDVELGWAGSSGATKTETATLGLTLKNTDKRFTAFDPRSPYWPHVREWTPIQYDIDLGDGVGWRNKFSGFVRNWAVKWPGASALMALARIEAVGELGHRERGKPPARSPMRRTIAASGPVAYWPCEDGTFAGWAASALPSHNPLTIDGTATFRPQSDYDRAFPEIVHGTAALIDLSAGASLTASVPGSATAATATGWTAYVATDVDLATLSGNLVLFDVQTPGGTFARWQMRITVPDLHHKIVAITPAGVETTVIDDANGVSTIFIGFTLSVWQNGANISVGINWNSTVSVFAATGSIAGTLAGVAGIGVNATKVTQTPALPMGHLTLWGTHPVPLDLRPAELSYAFRAGNIIETADARLARLCAEGGVSLVIPAVSADFATLMGPQPVGTFLDLVQQCVDADQGLLREQGFGFGFTPREARYNVPVALAIDAAARQLGMPFEPVSEDPNRRNMWTVKREGGSSAVARDDALIQVQGEIEGTATVHHADDSLLDGHARWRLRRSTAQEPRYPAVSIHLGAHPELAVAWCAVVPGSRINVVNPPAQNAPGPVDQIVVGAKETFRGRRSWRVTANIEPASPWTVAEADGDPRVDTDGSDLLTGVTSSATSLLVASTIREGVPWTSDAADLPYDINVGGEQIAVTAVNSPTFVAAGAAAHAVNASVTPALPAGIQVGDLLLILAAIRNTAGNPNAPTGYTQLADVSNMRLFGKVAQASESAPTVTFSGGVANADTTAQMAAFRGTTGTVSAQASQTNGSAQDIAYPALTMSHPACILLYLGWKQDDWGSVSTIVGGAEIGEPFSIAGDDHGLVWDYVIQPALADIDAGVFAVTGGAAAVSKGALVALRAAQILTVTRSVNGIVKAHATGTAVNVWEPAYAPL